MKSRVKLFFTAVILASLLLLALNVKHVENLATHWFEQPPSNLSEAEVVLLRDWDNCFGSARHRIDPPGSLRQEPQPCRLSADATLGHGLPGTNGSPPSGQTRELCRGLWRSPGSQWNGGSVDQRLRRAWHVSSCASLGMRCRDVMFPTNLRLRSWRPLLREPCSSEILCGRSFWGECRRLSTPSAIGTWAPMQTAESTVEPSPTPTATASSIGLCGPRQEARAGQGPHTVFDLRGGRHDETPDQYPPSGR